MGMDRMVTLADQAIPTWQAVMEHLCSRGFPIEMRMIDGELTFPDEIPPQTWSEVRVGTPEGMVTVRRSPGQLTFVTWGNAERPLREAWNALAWAFAELSGGQIQTENGTVDPRTFTQTAEMPEVLQLEEQGRE